MAYNVDIEPTSGALPHSTLPSVNRLKFRVDFTDSDNNLAQNETMKLWTIPANTWVLNAFIDVITADADVSDVDLGYGDGTAGQATNDDFVDGVTLATTGRKFTAGMTAPVNITSETGLLLENNDADTINGAVIDVVLDVIVADPSELV